MATIDGSNSAWVCVMFHMELLILYLLFWFDFDFSTTSISCPYTQHLPSLYLATCSPHVRYNYPALPRVRVTCADTFSQSSVYGTCTALIGSRKISQNPAPRTLNPKPKTLNP